MNRMLIADFFFLNSVDQGSYYLFYLYLLHTLQAVGLQNYTKLVILLIFFIYL